MTRRVAIEAGGGFCDRALAGSRGNGAHRGVARPRRRGRAGPSGYHDHRGRALVGHGHPVLTFDYSYMEAGRRFPDRREALLRCHRAAAAWLGQRCDRLVMAGRSMGGRMASYLAVEGQPCAGLVLYAYPLHPAGKPHRLRADHLPLVPVPMLFFTGQKDRLALPHSGGDAT